EPGAARIRGLLPTGWYPSAVVPLPGGRVAVVNLKGIGSRNRPPNARGYGVKNYLGSVNVFDAAILESARLAEATGVVIRANRWESLAGPVDAKGRASPVPLPARWGEPSVIKHVLYIIKEHRTYDQVLGDVREGDGDPSLVQFGEEVTPNHHALAREFVLLDRFY